ncbi:ankyrin repeat-containing domain protein [Trichoderma pleuroticola]
MVTMMGTPAGKTNDTTVYKAPEELSSNLDAAFEEILLKIDENLQSLAISSLKWLAFSFERLTIDLFTEIFAQYTDKSAPLDEAEKLSSPYIALKCLSGLVVVAALGGHTAVVRFFVEDEALAAALNGADVRKWVLNAAAEDSHFDIIELLVRNGTEVDEYTFEKVAGSSKDEAAILECLPFLLDNSPDITKEGALCNAAFWALDIDQSRIEYLLGLGADPNVQGGDHGIALQAVCYSYSSRDEDACIKVVKLLIALGVDIAAQGGEYGNALNNVCASKGNDGMCWYSMAACHHGNSDLVPLLLAWGANVHAQGGAFTTALHAACFTRPRERKEGDVEMIRLLLDHGAHIQVPGVSSGSVLHAVASSNKSKYNSLLLRVLELGADINQADERGGTALHYALQNMRFDSKDTKPSRVRLLIEHDADVHLAVGDLGSPLYSICVATTNLSDVYEKDRTVALLLEICPDIDGNAQGGEYGSALQAAAWYEKVYPLEMDVLLVWFVAQTLKELQLSPHLWIFIHLLYFRLGEFDD